MKVFRYNKLGDFLTAAEAYDSPKVVKMVHSWQQTPQFKITATVFLHTHLLEWAWSSVEAEDVNYYLNYDSKIIDTGFVRGEVRETVRLGGA